MEGLPNQETRIFATTDLPEQFCRRFGRGAIVDARHFAVDDRARLPIFRRCRRSSCSSCSAAATRAGTSARGTAATAAAAATVRCGRVLVVLQPGRRDRGPPLALLDRGRPIVLAPVGALLALLRHCSLCGVEVVGWLVGAGVCFARVWPAISARSRDRLPGAVPLRLHTSANSGIVWAHARQHDYHYHRRDFFPLHRDTCTYKLAKSALAEGPRDRAHTHSHTLSLGTPHRAAHFFTTTYTTHHSDPLVDHARASEELGRKDADRQKFLAVNSVSVIYIVLSLSLS